MDHNYKFNLGITNINNQKDAIWQGYVAVFLNNLHTDRRNKYCHRICGTQWTAFIFSAYITWY